MRGSVFLKLEQPNTPYRLTKKQKDKNKELYIIIKSLEKKNPLIMFEGVILFESIEKNFSSILVKQQNEIVNSR